MSIMDLQRLVRPNIWNLRPYSSARSEFVGKAQVLIDANESPFNEPYNRYPDPLQRQLKSRLAGMKGVAEEHIFLGVGSDECIDLAFRIFCEPAVDNVVAIAPTYGMYEVCADINNVEYRTVQLNENFAIDVGRVIAACDRHTKIVWLCSPNNPTGNAFALGDMLDVDFHTVSLRFYCTGSSELPSIASSSCSPITAIPSSLALSSLLPASSPATT